MEACYANIVKMFHSITHQFSNNCGFFGYGNIGSTAADHQNIFRADFLLFFYCYNPGLFKVSYFRNYLFNLLIYLGSSPGSNNFTSGFLYSFSNFSYLLQSFTLTKNNFRKTFP